MLKTIALILASALSVSTFAADLKVGERAPKSFNRLVFKTLLNRLNQTTLEFGGRTHLMDELLTEAFLDNRTTLSMNNVCVVEGQDENNDHLPLYTCNLYIRVLSRNKEKKNRYDFVRNFKITYKASGDDEKSIALPQLISNVKIVSSND